MGDCQLHTARGNDLLREGSRAGGVRAARSKEQATVGSKEQGARSKEQGARSREQGARSREQGARIMLWRLPSRGFKPLLA